MSGYFEPVAAVESDSNAAQTYEVNLGIEVVKKKVENVDPAELLRLANERGYGYIDAVIGGPPCRPFTVANKGGTRWEKIKENNKNENDDVEHPDWLNFFRIVEALDPQPRIVIAENVTGFRNHGDIFLKFLNRLRKYYATDHLELHADCFGVPQNRKRIFIAGVKDFAGANDTILPPNPQPTQKVSVRDAISDLPKLSNDSPGSALSKYKRGKPTRYQSLLRNGCSDLYDHIVHSVHPVMAERFGHIPQGYNLRRAWAEGIIPEASMRSQYFMGKVKKEFSEDAVENMHSNIYRRLRWEDVSCTIAHVRKTVLIHPLQNRLISVREAARLQSFPDWFRFSGSISQQYQQIADAVPPFLAQAIASHLAELLMRMPNPTTLQMKSSAETEHVMI